MPNRRNHDPGAVEGLFTSQGGLATRAQLLAMGVAPSTIRYRERADGPWYPVLRGVSANHGRPLGLWDRIKAALLFAGPGAVVTGFAALLAQHIRPVIRGSSAPGAQCASGRPITFGTSAAAGQVRVLIPHSRRRSPTGFVVIGRTTRLPDPVVIDGCSLAPPARAVVDACLETRDPGVIRAVVGDVVRAGRCSAQELALELESHQTRHSASLRRVLAEYLPGARSEAEVCCRQRLARSAAPQPLWNRRIVEQQTGHSSLLPGALWPEHGVALEVAAQPDTRLTPEEWEQAVARRRWMTSALRLTVAHVTPNQLRDSWDEVWADLRRLLQRPPTYRLPPGYRIA